MPPSKKTVSWRELRVGLLVLGSIAILVFLILNASGDINRSAKLHLKARFADANGLRKVRKSDSQGYVSVRSIRYCC